jgi:hypothetical protein
LGPCAVTTVWLQLDLTDTFSQFVIVPETLIEVGGLPPLPLTLVMVTVTPRLPCGVRRTGSTGFESVLQSDILIYDARADHNLWMHFQFRILPENLAQHLLARSHCEWRKPHETSGDGATEQRNY